MPLTRILCIACLIWVGLLWRARALDCGESGQLLRETHRSELTGRARAYSLYLPPCFDAVNGSYPLLTLLHGSNADDQQWLRLGAIAELEARILRGDSPPLLLLLPDGGAAANENRFDATGYGASLLELMERVAESAGAENRWAIGGISRGGFWAYHLGLRYPERFVAIGGHSAYFDPRHFDAPNNPLHLARELPADTSLRLWLDRGTRDHAASGLDRMHNLLRRRGVAHDYVVYAGGGHDEASWRAHVSEYLDFYVAALAGRDDAKRAGRAAITDGVELWLPAGGFPTLRTSIARAELEAVLASQHDLRLVMSADAAERLRERGIALHADTRIVPPGQLTNHLWRDKLAYTLLPFDALHPRLRSLWLDDRPIVAQLDGYPLVFESDAPNFSPGRLTRITLSGTTAIARATRNAVDRMGIGDASSGIRDYTRESDFFGMTSEATIADGCPRFTGIELGGANSLCMKHEHGGLFAALGADVIDLTGNHINDYGYGAFGNMLDFFAGQGMAVVGGGLETGAARQPLILEHHGNRIGWLACNAIGPYYALVNEDENALGGARPGAAYCDRDWLRDALPVLASQVDLTLLTVHYREFESHLPTDQQRYDFRGFAEWGADAVIGSAEHKAMIFEFYPTRRGETAFIHYGLGNLFFDQLPWGNRRFFMDTLHVYAGELLMVELFPGLIEDQARPRLLTGDDQFNFLHYIFIQQNGW